MLLAKQKKNILGDWQNSSNGMFMRHDFLVLLIFLLKTLKFYTWSSFVVSEDMRIPEI